MAGAFGHEHYDVSMKMAEAALLPAVRAAPGATDRGGGNELPPADRARRGRATRAIPSPSSRRPCERARRTAGRGAGGARLPGARRPDRQPHARARHLRRAAGARRAHREPVRERRGRRVPKAKRLTALFHGATEERSSIVLFIDSAGAKVSEGLGALGAFRLLYRAGADALLAGVPIARGPGAQLLRRRQHARAPRVRSGCSRPRRNSRCRALRSSRPARA